jgi:hypothetical protein
MRPRFPDLPKRSRIVREDPTAEQANLPSDISFGCQQGKFAFIQSSAIVFA